MPNNSNARAYWQSCRELVVGFAAVAVALTILSGHAAAGVSCPRQKLQSAINAAAAGQLMTITFTGTCTENLVVPYGKSVALVGGASNATITPKDATQPAVRSLGSTEIRLATVSSAGVSQSLVEAVESGRISLVASTLRSGSVYSLLRVNGNSYASIVNSELNGGTGSSVDVSMGSTVVAVGDSGATQHRVNGKKTLVTAISPVILFNCVTSTLHINVGGSGSVKLTGGRAAVIPSQCRIGIYNGASPSSNIELSNFSGSALGGSMSTYDIQGLTIKNSEYGILAAMTSFQIGAATFSNNSSGDIWVGNESVVNIPSFGGYEKTQFLDAVDGIGRFNCYSGSRIDINQATVVQDLGNSSNNCVTVY